MLEIKKLYGDEQRMILSVTGDEEVPILLIFKDTITGKITDLATNTPTNPFPCRVPQADWHRHLTKEVLTLLQEQGGN